ncbi:MAG: SHOCT domain-containing protein [Prevotella sp.]|nr:SHOCT domain-containing protein [Prevotella sp.]MBO5615057.1 SHOCT domain-containing protein [Prevotella sp.]
METILILIGLGFVGAIVLGLINGHNQREEAKERGLTFDERISEMPNFTPSQKVNGFLNHYMFAVDKQHRKVAYIEEDKEKFIAFEDIISVEIIEDNMTLASKSTMRTIGGTVVGGALAGGAGAVVGGLSGDSKMKKKVSLVQVKMRIRDIDNPTLTINCYDCKTMTSGQEAETDGLLWGVYKQGLEHAQQITDLVSVIIDDVDRAEKQNLSSTVTMPSGSIAEELEKLAILRDKGILTDEEFKEQKMKLLK